MAAAGLEWHGRVSGNCPGKPGQGALAITLGDGETLVSMTLATEKSCALSSLCAPGVVLQVLSWLLSL